LKGKLIKRRSVAPSSAQKKVHAFAIEKISKKNESRCYCAAQDLLLRKLGNALEINQQLRVFIGVFNSKRVKIASKLLKIQG
jgi:hypothetical protein